MRLLQFFKPLLLIALIAISGLSYAQYTGGIEDGYTLSSINQVKCNTVVYSNIYTGGIEDGYASLSINQVKCDTVVYSNIYTGGIEDGYASLSINQVKCDTVVYSNIYTGGIEDGYASLSINQVKCDTVVYSNIYTGGVEDGYASLSINQVKCDTIAYSDIYIGGVEDGHAMIEMLTACAPFAEFEADKLEICEGDTVNYTDLSLGMPTSWAWTFNGGNPSNSTEQNPSVTYNTPGTYSVTLFITSDKGNSTITKTDYILVKPVPAIPVIAASGATTFCDGDSVLLTCNTAYNSYLWSNGDTTQNSYVYTSGSHTVRAIAANGCFSESNTIEVNVLNNPKPTVFVNGPSPSCIGDTLVLTSSLANSYNWMPSGSTAQSITVTSSGTHWISATYASGCSRLSDPVSVNFGSTPAKPTINALSSTTFCEGDSVILQSSPAPGYLWYPDSQATQSVAIYTSGTYYVGAVGAHGCTNISDPITVTVNPKTPVPTVDTSGPLTFCDGDSVVLTSSNANSYLWAPNGETTKSITVKASGTYTVQADNGTGCTSNSLPVVVTVNPLTPVPTVDASGPLTFCEGDSVVLTSSDANSYLWAPNGETTKSITVKASGTYSVQTDNGTSCTANSLPVVVTVHSKTPAPTITANAPLVLCEGDSVVLTSSDANSYLWAPNGETTKSITVKTSGTYTVQADNGTGCTTNSLPVVVTVNPSPSVPTISLSGPASFCHGDSVVLTASPASYYLWSNGDTTQSITVTTEGTYYVDVSIGSCKAISLPVSIDVLPVPAIPTIAISGSNNICEGDSVLLTSSPASSYLWHPGGETTQSIWVSASGSYWVEVFNGSGCSTISNAQSISVHPNLSVSILGETVACQGTSELYTVTNLPSTNYFWTVSGAAIIGGGGTNSIEVSFNNEGNVTIDVTVVSQVSGCSASDAFIVNVLSAPTASAGPDLNICIGDTVQLQASGGTTYSWTPNVGLSASDVSNPYAFPLATTQYVVEVANGSCSDRDTMLLTVNPLPIANAGSDVNIFSGECITLNGSGGITYYWQPATGLNSQTINSPDACPTETTLYTMLVTDANGCSAKDSIMVFVSGRSGDMVFPNTFTPNGDGINDTWVIDGLEAYPEHKLVIFNRWGNKVYDAKPYLNEWNGDCVGKPLPDGTYYFVLDLGDGSETIRSFVTIIR